MKINPFDKTEWPLGWMSPANWLKPEFLEAFRNWRERWEHEIMLWYEHSGRWLHFVAVDYPEIKESLSPQKLMELREKAQNWDDLQSSAKVMEK